jgi:hypothetical protein
MEKWNLEYVSDVYQSKATKHSYENNLKSQSTSNTCIPPSVNLSRDNSETTRCRSAISK